MSLPDTSKTRMTSETTPNTDEKTELKNRIIQKVRSKLKATTSHGYFHGHECHLDAKDLSAYNINIGPGRHFIFDLTTVRISDVRALNMYRSYAILGAERYRHYIYHSFTIHPFSKLRLIFETIMILTMITLGAFLAVYFSKVDTFLKHYHFRFVLFCDFMFMLNIMSNFLTGYIAGHCKKVTVLDLRKIAWNYIKTWLIVDIICSISFVPLLFPNANLAYYVILEGMKLLQLPTTVKYIKNILHVTGATMCQQLIVLVIFSILSYLSWNIYFQFAIEYIIEGTFHPEKPRKCSWLSYAKVWNETWPIRFLYSMERGVAMLTTNTNMNVIDDLGCFEVFFVVSWLVSQLLKIHFALKYVLVLFGTESARAKYYIMQKQVEHYMRQRKFLPRLKKKILKFYAIRFQAKYFTVERMLAAMSGQLRDDILMHTGHQLVREQEFLNLLPRSLLMQVIFKLRVVIFIAGDIIFKINTIGDCLYFIDRGTVAIYSDSAQEICHLEDGDFFGEVSLVMHHRFRTTSAVAVTNCELYRLDKEDFDTTIAYYTSVFYTIKKVAMSRFDMTCVMDEHHKADLKTAEAMESM